MIESATNGADDDIRSEWVRDELPPLIFIMGLHRSGTTFLYESLAQILSVTKLTVQDVVFYPNLIRSFHADGGAADQYALNNHFSQHHVQTRGNDELPLSPSTVEEYGWILKRMTGSYELSEKSLSVFTDLVCKLSYMHAENDAILLKNPWDIGNSAVLASLFPKARFIFIKRDPIEILDSELRNALHFSRSADPLLELLTHSIVDTRILIAAMRIVRSVMGERFFSKVCIRLLFADVVRNMKLYKSSIKAMSADRLIEISYQNLIENPKRTMVGIVSFLRLPLINSTGLISAKRRSRNISTLVRALEPELRSRIGKDGDGC